MDPIQVVLSEKPTISCAVHAPTLFANGSYGHAQSDRQRKIVSHADPQPPSHIRTLSLIEAIYLVLANRIEILDKSVNNSGNYEMHSMHFADGDKTGSVPCSCPQRRPLTTGESVRSLALLAYSMGIYGSICWFAARACVYLCLKRRGWVVRDGMRFGCDYVAYKEGGPRNYHADYCIQVGWEQGSPDCETGGMGNEQMKDSGKITWSRVLASIRFTEQTKKKVVRATVALPLLRELGPVNGTVDLKAQGTGATIHEKESDDNALNAFLKVVCDGYVQFVEISRWNPR